MSFTFTPENAIIDHCQGCGRRTEMALLKGVSRGICRGCRAKKERKRFHAERVSKPSLSVMFRELAWLELPNFEVLSHLRYGAYALRYSNGENGGAEIVPKGCLILGSASIYVSNGIRGRNFEFDLQGMAAYLTNKGLLATDEPLELQNVQGKNLPLELYLQSPMYSIHRQDVLLEVPLEGVLEEPEGKD